LTEIKNEEQKKKEETRIIKQRNERDIQRADLIGECDQNDKRNPNRSVTRRSD